MKLNITVTKVQVAEFAERLLQEGYFIDIFDDMYRTRDFSAETCMAAVEREAELRGIELTGMGDFDADAVFTSAYQVSEKGLS